MSEDMIGLGSLMLIFGITLILVGIYMFTGHKCDLLFGKAIISVKNITKEELKRIGKIIIIIGLIITITSLIILLAV